MKGFRFLAAAALFLFPLSAHADDARERFVALVEELRGFKANREFQEVGFSACCPYAAWAERVKGFSREDAGDVIVQFEVAPVDLWLMAADLRSRSPATRHAAAERLAALNEAIRLYRSGRVPKAGQGRIVASDIACDEVSILLVFADAMIEGDYLRADDGLDAAKERGACRRLRKGTIVAGPFGERESGIARLIEIELPDGSRVWTGESNLSFTAE